jgi:hypothetical protein
MIDDARLGVKSLLKRQQKFPAWEGLRKTKALV